MPRLLGWLCAFVALFFQTPTLQAQEISGYAVIDGTLNPPQVVEGTVNIAIVDNGTGSYTLTFDQPVVFFLGTSMTEGGGFDVSPSFLTATQDSLNPSKVLVTTRYPSYEHFPVDAPFSVEVRLAPPPP